MKCDCTALWIQFETTDITEIQVNQPAFSTYFFRERFDILSPLNDKQC